MKAQGNQEGLEVNVTHHFLAFVDVNISISTMKKNTEALLQVNRRLVWK